MQTDVLIIGAGPVGIFTAFYAGMLSLKCIVCDANEKIGGQPEILYPEKYIYDIPAIPKITGSALSLNLKEQASRFEPEYLTSEEVVSFEKIQDDEFVVTTKNNIQIKSKVIIFTSGSGLFEFKKLPLNNIEHLENDKIFYHVSDKNIVKDKRVCILGGGDSAMDFALEFSSIANKVYIVHRRENFSCHGNTLDLLKVQNHAVEFVCPYQVSDIILDNNMLKILINNFNGEEKILEVDYAFAFYGLVQNSNLVKKSNLKTYMGKILVNQTTMESSIEGIYAAGDVAHFDSKIKLILCGFSEAVYALYHASGRIKKQKIHVKHSTDVI
jgi:thioredoxin reductase (NADPH)